jgi:hypothetical protein
LDKKRKPEVLKMKKNVMKRAHQIAKSLEGDYRARMSLALRQAWREVTVQNMVLKVNHQPSGGKEWVAEITGRDPKYKFQREFLQPVSRDWSSSGKTGFTSFELEPGKVYEVNEPWKGRRFVEIQNGEIKTLDTEEVLSKIA